MPPPNPRKWTLQIFNAKAVRDGGIVRRARADVKQYGDYGLLKSEVQKRGFHLLRTGEQYVILCHKGDLRLIC